MNMSGFYSAFYSVIKLMLPLGSFRSMHIVYPKMLNTIIKKKWYRDNKKRIHEFK